MSNFICFMFASHSVQKGAEGSRLMVCLDLCLTLLSRC